MGRKYLKGDRFLPPYKEGLEGEFENDGFRVVHGMGRIGYRFWTFAS